MEGRQQEEGYPDSTGDGKTADMASEEENILAEMGIIPEQEEVENPEGCAENYGVGVGSEPIGKRKQKKLNLHRNKEIFLTCPIIQYQIFPDLEAETTGNNYADGMLEADGIPVETENGEISNAEEL
ncbi:MAG: hypothetical protein ACLSEA_10115 [Thomasclavelia ramosa]